VQIAETPSPFVAATATPQISSRPTAPAISLAV